jgi:hypothetical protein
MTTSEPAIVVGLIDIGGSLTFPLMIDKTNRKPKRDRQKGSEESQVGLKSEVTGRQCRKCLLDASFESSKSPFAGIEKLKRAPS